jgi:hypothetical protein
MSQFVVWCPYLGSTQDDGTTIVTFSAEHAAKTWARNEDADSADYWIVKSFEGTTVKVLEVSTGTIHNILVTGEAEPIYTAMTISSEAPTLPAHKPKEPQ